MHVHLVYCAHVAVVGPAQCTAVWYSDDQRADSPALQVKWASSMSIPGLGKDT